jgi:hypothetical protein
MKKILPIALAFSLAACQNNPKPAVDSETTSTVEVSQVLSDAEKRLQKYVNVKLTTDVSMLSENQRKMIPSLIKVAKIMDGLFWKQAYGDKEEFLKSISNENTRQFANINYGPWDRLDGNEPFVDGVGEKPLGANYYPADMTKEEFESSDLEGKNRIS